VVATRNHAPNAALHVAFTAHHSCVHQLPMPVRFGQGRHQAAVIVITSRPNQNPAMTSASRGTSEFVHDHRCCRYSRACICNAVAASVSAVRHTKPPRKNRPRSAAHNRSVRDHECSAPFMRSILAIYMTHPSGQLHFNLAMILRSRLCAISILAVRISQVRMRRMRRDRSRGLMREHHLTVDDLIYPSSYSKA